MQLISLDNLSRYHNNLQSFIEDKLKDMTASSSLEYCTDEDILRLFDPSIPETPVEPEIPVESIGSITDDNSIAVDETRLENGTYTLRYVDANDNIIDNFNEITSFEINK
jgi:hypothetical protein